MAGRRYWLSRLMRGKQTNAVIEGNTATLPVSKTSYTILPSGQWVRKAKEQ